MASVHRVDRSPYWHCFFTMPDGRRTHRSTGIPVAGAGRSKSRAMGVCIELEKASMRGKEGRLTEARARKTLADIFEVANSQAMPAATIKQVLDSWLERKRLEVAESSVVEYERAAREFLAHLGAKAKRPADALTVSDVSAWRNMMAARVSGGTVNKYLKILQGAFVRATRDGVLQENPFIRVDSIKARKSERRAFTEPELAAILHACDTEWRGIVLFGFYTGQRLGDISRLTWRNVDLEREEVRLTTRKTERPMVIPMPGPLVRYCVTLPAADDPGAPLFPRANGFDVATLSRQFCTILAHLGLRDPVAPHRKTEQSKGRDARRTTGGVSFHCLRHTATSALKNAGVSDAVAREIIGHDSESISRAYTHIETKALREAVNRLPDWELIKVDQTKKGGQEAKQTAPAGK
jgi:integrase